MDTINGLRKIIDDIDGQILDLIKSRLDVVKEIGEVKKINKINIVDEGREQEIFDNLIKKAKEKNINPDVVKKIWDSLLEAAYKVEGDENAKS